jgi:hypothetical protein
MTREQQQAYQRNVIRDEYISEEEVNAAVARIISNPAASVLQRRMPRGEKGMAEKMGSRMASH